MSGRRIVGLGNRIVSIYYFVTLEKRFSLVIIFHTLRKIIGNKYHRLLIINKLFRMTTSSIRARIDFVSPRVLSPRIGNIIILCNPTSFNSIYLM